MAATEEEKPKKEKKEKRPKKEKAPKVAKPPPDFKSVKTGFVQKRG